MCDVLSKFVLLGEKKMQRVGPSLHFEVFLKILENILEIILAKILNNNIPMTCGELDVLGVINTTV